MWDGDLKPWIGAFVRATCTHSVFVCAKRTVQHLWKIHMYIWKSIFVYIYEIHMLRPTFLSLYICKCPALHNCPYTLLTLYICPALHFRPYALVSLHICPALHIYTYTFAPPYAFVCTHEPHRGNGSKPNFVELWSVSRPRFGRDGHRDMGDVSTYGKLIWNLLGSMKPPDSNLCADTRKYKSLRASQRVKTERDLHWVERGLLFWIFGSNTRI